MSLKGKKNIYLCHKCGHGFVTVDVDEGTTPFATNCDHPGCGGVATSLCYGAPQPVLASVKPSFEWYKPASTERLSAGEVEHVLKGGLLKRRVPRVASGVREVS